MASPSAEAEALAERSQWSVAHRTIEADLRSDLAQVLVPYALDVIGLPQQAIRQEGTGIAGRFDSMFGEAIIEYKAPQLLRSRREREDAAAQALSYLDDEALGARVVVITDGETWGVLRDIEIQPEIGEQVTLDLGEPSLIPPIARFAWRESTAEACQVVLDLLSSLKAAPVDSRNLIAFLGPARQEVVALLGSLSEVLGDRASNDRTDVLFDQWIRSAGIAYGIADADARWPLRSPKERVLGPLAPVFQNRTYAETVYTLHTYVALATKLVAAEVLAFQAQQPELRPSQWAHLDKGALLGRFDQLESGELSEQLGAPGLLASDLFDWYAHEAHHSDELTTVLRETVGLLGRLAWARVANAGGMKIDLLRDLYQAVVPRPLRKALGEFFTPRWLAEYVFARAFSLWAEHRELDGSSPPRILDPACGSGTFLVAAIRAGLARLDQIEAGDDYEHLSVLTEAIIGFDINPVSALMSRVNLLLALGDRASVMPEVSFHVYQADSIVLPRVETGQMALADEAEDVLIVPTAIEDFRIARSLMTSRRMAVLRHNLETSLRAGVGRALFVRALEGELAGVEPLQDAERELAIKSAEELFDRLAALRAEERDDVWARVLEQAVAPLLLQPADIVVGNPPWVSWKDLPDAWKRRSEPIWRSWGLWRTRRGGQGLPLSDISTLMVARSIVSYCDDGIVGMLLPQSVQLADPSGRAFRRSHLRPDDTDASSTTEKTDVKFRVSAADDFTRINPFSPDAANLTIALYIRPGEPPSFPVPTRRWRRVPRARLRSEWGWAAASTRLESTDTSIEPVDSDPASPWGYSPEPGALPLRRASERTPYQLGRGYETRGLDGLFTFSVLTPAPTGPHHHVRVENVPEAGDNTRGEPPKQGVVEADVLWPLVKGEDVSKWRVVRTERYWFVPYSAAIASAPPTELTTEDVASRFPRMFQYVEPWIERYASRSLYQRDAEEDFPWSLSGPVEYLRSDGALLFVRYIGAPVAAVAVASFDPKLGRDTLPIPNNKSNIYYAASVEEACYLAAFINSYPAQAALQRFAVSTGVTPAAIARLPLPKFEANSTEHRRLSELGQTATEQTAADDADGLKKTEQAIDEAVWAVVREARE